jgi:hypothetical protein
MPGQAEMALTEKLVSGLNGRGEAGEDSDAYDYRKDYWLTKEPDDLAPTIVERFQKHVERWQGGSPVAATAWNAYRVYHGLTRADRGDSPVVTLTETGKDGEFLSLSVNEIRGLLRHQVAMVTSHRPAWQPQARTGGAEASRQVALCESVLDHAMDAKGVEQTLANQLEGALVAASFYSVVGWDALAGRGGQGDVWVQEFAPWELCSERVRKYTDTRHWIFRRLEPRWDWVAKFSLAALAEPDPEERRKLSEKAERLKGIEYDRTWFTDVDERPMSTSEDTDRIPVLYLLAAPSIACPDGRRTVVAAADLWLEDGPLPYDGAPVVRMCPAEFLGTSEGIADIWSQLASQEALNGVLGALITRIDIGAVPDTAVPQGSNYEQGTLGGGNQLEVPPDGQPPTLIDRMAIPPALVAVADWLIKSMEKGTGINSVTRGAPTENITSGNMAALVQAMAVQFNSATERAYAKAMEELGTIIVKMYQRHATEEQLISIAGQDQRYTVQSFRAEDLNQITRVAVKIASPLMKTTAGRSELATRMLEQKVIQDPREYLEVVETGRLQPIFKGAIDQLRIIQEENEALRRGEPVHVEMSDDPYLHIREHGCELDTRARYDQAYAQRLRDHNEEHYQVLLKMSREDPDRCIAFGYQPLPGALQLAAQAGQIMGMGQGPTPDQAKGAAQPQVPGQETKKTTPGPEPKPPGREQPTAAPGMPEPAQPPKGAQV